MLFGVNSCLCTSTQSLLSDVDKPYKQQESPEHNISSGGYVTTSSTVRASEIKPLVSSIHPKKRMSESEYLEYKEMMKNLGCLQEKKVSFKEPDDSSSKKLVISTDYDIPREHPISADYDIPRKHPISADYDIPRKHPISSDYDIPRKYPISANYDIPRK